MFRASLLLLLVSCAMVVGCDTGSTAQNVSTTGWKGQKVGNDEGRTGGSTANASFSASVNTTG